MSPCSKARFFDRLRGRHGRLCLGTIRSRANGIYCADSKSSGSDAVRERGERYDRKGKGKAKPPPPRSAKGGQLR